MITVTQSQTRMASTFLMSGISLSQCKKNQSIKNVNVEQWKEKLNISLPLFLTGFPHAFMSCFVCRHGFVRTSLSSHYVRSAIRSFLLLLLSTKTQCFTDGAETEATEELVDT